MPARLADVAVISGLALAALNGADDRLEYVQPVPPDERMVLALDEVRFERRLALGQRLGISNQQN